MMARRIFNQCFKRPRRRKHRTLTEAKHIKFDALVVTKKYPDETRKIAENTMYPDFDENVENKLDAQRYNKSVKLPKRKLLPG